MLRCVHASWEVCSREILRRSNTHSVYLSETVWHGIHRGFLASHKPIFSHQNWFQRNYIYCVCVCSYAFVHMNPSIAHFSFRHCCPHFRCIDNRLAWYTSSTRSEWSCFRSTTDEWVRKYTSIASDLNTSSECGHEIASFAKPKKNNTLSQ